MRIFTQHSWRMLAVIAVTMLFAGTAAAQDAQVSPLNPDFVAWQSAKPAPVSDDGHPLGWIPSPVDWSHLKNYPPAKSDKQLPASYDLRTLGHVSPVGDQVVSGPCWAFAALASVEGWLLHGPGEARDFSEYHLIWKHGFDWTPLEGGNNSLSTAYFLRGHGPVSEADVPYVTPPDTPAADAVLRKYVKSRWALAAPEDIKAAIMDEGPISTNLFYDSDYYNAVDYTYYCPLDVSTNHGVALVGWDDTMDIAGHIGAWIVKNSWGTGWGDNGFFYLSYDDESSLANVAAFVDIVPPGYLLPHIPIRSLRNDFRRGLRGRDRLWRECLHGRRG